MPKPLPPENGESFTPPVADDWRATGHKIRALGATGLPSDATGPETSSEAKRFRGILLSAHEAADQLLPDLTPPTLGAFESKGLDVESLRAGYEAYERAGLAPELVLAPLNLSYLEWRTVYNRLFDWQRFNSPDDERYMLQEKFHGDGLSVIPKVIRSWDAISRAALETSPGVTVAGRRGISWGCLVIPTASTSEGGRAVHTSFDLAETSEEFLQQVEVNTGSRDLPNGIHAHAPLGAFLTLQAMRIRGGRPLMDDDAYTWASPTFEDTAGLSSLLFAPITAWSSTEGKVSVTLRHVNNSDDDIGARLPIWGGAKDA